MAEVTHALDAIDTTWSDVITKSIDVLSRYAVPLYFDDKNDRPVLFGTGFFVRAEADHFLVSAAHVLDRAAASGLYFYISPNTKCKVTGALRRTGSLGKRLEDRLDIGVVKLTSNVVPPFRDVNKFAVDISNLTPHYLPRAGRHYVIIGFPANKSEVDRYQKSVTAAPYAYRSDPIHDNAYQDLGVDSKTHIVLPLNRTRGFDTKGKIIHFPKPYGMSGAPIFVLYENENEDEDENENESDFFPIIGVGIEYTAQKKCLVGTDIRVALEMIRKAF